MKLLKLSSILFAANIAFAASEDFSLKNKDFCEMVLTEYRDGIIGKSENPIRTLQKVFGDSVYDAELKFGIKKLEDDIIALFETAPEFRNLDYLKDKWGFSDQQMLDVVAFYGLRVFEDARVVGRGEEVLNRIRTLARNQFLKSDNPTAKRYSYYMQQVGLLSVPEMAKQLGITEHRVYQDLNMLDISIVERFESRTKDFADQAGRFVRHYLRAEQRGVGWDRALSFEGRLWTELEILFRLHEDGLTSAQIADKLNSLAGIVDPAHPDIRTQHSVNLKLQSYHSNQEQVPVDSQKDLYHPRYGFLKIRGVLNSSPVLQFLLENSGQSTAWLKKQLQIGDSTLYTFRKKMGLIVEDRSKSPTIELGRLEKYERQRRAVALVVAWVKANEGKIPSSKDYKVNGGEDKIKLNYSAFMGLGDYASGARYENLAVFGSLHEALLAMKRGCEANGVRFPLFKAPVTGERSEELAHAIRNDIADEVLDWFTKAGSEKNIYEKIQIAAKIPFKELGLVRTNVMGQRKDHRSSSNDFDSSGHFLVFTAKRARERGMEFYVLETQLFATDVSAELRTIRREQFVELIVDWMIQHGRNSIKEWHDFGSEPGKIPMDYRRAVSKVPYSPNEQLPEGAGIFPSFEALNTAVMKRYFELKIRG